MRPKKFLTLLFVVIVQFCYGQEYHKIVDTNKVWSIIDEYTAGGGQPYSQFIKFTTDTLIGSYNYKKVLRSRDSTQTVWSHIGFIREDSTAKVYYMDNSYLEGLIYDFNVNINDTINIYNPLVCPMLMTCIVEQIDSIFIYNNYRKQIHILSAFGSEVWIEGIGSNRGILYTNQCSVGDLFKLLCFYENDTLKYINPDYDSCFYPFVNINENEDEKPVLLIDLENNSYIIQAKSSIEEVTIYNVLGEKMGQYNPFSNQCKINMSSFSSGIYFITCKTSNKLFNIKIVKP